MTLKEKFNNALDLDNDKYITYECKEIADEFAIGFSKWCLEIGVYTQFKKTQGINKELLEIYKKEIGL
jgi:hypothetical protein